MRLRRVERGHRLRQKLMLGMIRVLSGRRPQDILRTLFYRPELFGKPFSACLQPVMRGPSDWSVGERELFAAFVSRKNQCPF
jgi:hypothetical protein